MPRSVGLGPGSAGLWRAFLRHAVCDAPDHIEELGALVMVKHREHDLHILKVGPVNGAVSLHAGLGEKQGGAAAIFVILPPLQKPIGDQSRDEARRCGGRDLKLLGQLRGSAAGVLRQACIDVL